jgi:hypothetical protein
MHPETDLTSAAQHLDDVGRAWSELASTLGVASVSFADTVAAMRGITFFQYGNGQTLSGISPTYDPSIIARALYVRQQRDEMFRAT